jgi:type I restriction enzyme S subunit
MTLMNDFLFLILQTVGYRDHLDLHAHGTANQASINVSDMLDFFIPLPGLAEQEEIARFISEELAKFDTLTAEAQRAIDLLQERRTALISAAVTGQIDVRSAVAAS